MSKTLYIARHAKAEDHSSSDFARQLTATGIADAHKVGERLYQMEIKPQKVLSSPAPRALRTAEIFTEEMKLDRSRLSTDKLLYYAKDVEELYNLVKNTPDSIESMMIVGHNPFLKELADLLFEKDVEWLPKCAVAGLEFNVQSWSNIHPKSSVILFFTHPKEYIYYDIYQLKYEEDEHYFA